MLNEHENSSDAFLDLTIFRKTIRASFTSNREEARRLNLFRNFEPNDLLPEN